MSPIRDPEGSIKIAGLDCRHYSLKIVPKYTLNKAFKNIKCSSNRISVCYPSLMPHAMLCYVERSYSFQSSDTIDHFPNF